MINTTPQPAAGYISYRSRQPVLFAKRHFVLGAAAVAPYPAMPEERLVTEMRYLPDGDQMKAADTYTIEKMGIPSLVLMERAALETVRVMEEHKINTARALVVCGSGNNGGDGFAIARLLREKGMTAEILFAGKESSLSQECSAQKKIAERMGIPVFTEIAEKEYTVIIDAIFGVGLSRDVSGKYKDVIEWMNRQDAQKVAVDIPSGVCARTGKILGTAFRAELTVCMACVKVGCELFPGKNFSGQTVPVQIGISPDYFKENTQVCFTCDRQELPAMLPRRKADSHKGTYGKLLMITGSKGMAGAAFLSARSACAVGAGLVQIYTAEENRTVLQQLLPEAIISCYTVFEKEKLTELVEWADTVCIGCGLGQEDISEQLMRYTLSLVRESGKSCVIDADGLNILSRHIKALEKQGTGRTNLILTPHMKEMSRLYGMPVSRIGEERVELLRKFVEKYPVVCALKDSRTVVMQEGKAPFVNLAGNNAMAKAGSGDVLAGVIAGLCAQGMEPYDSAVTGVFLHACGGDAARDEKGSYSVLARDLIRGVEMCTAQTYIERTAYMPEI